MLQNLLKIKMFIKQQKTRSESLVRKPGVQKTMKIDCSNEAHNNASNNGGFTEVWQFNMKRMLKKVWKISRNYKINFYYCEIKSHNFITTIRIIC